MSFLLKESVHQSLIETLYNEIISNRSIYYYFIGNILQWENELVPGIPLDTAAYEKYTRDGIISVKRINLRDVSLVVPRRDWSSNVVYDQYDDYSSSVLSNSGSPSLKNSNFYVLSSNYNVYKCLYNNEGANSTIEPSETDFTPINTSDGYIWKYMYSIPLANRNKFLTYDYMPVQRAINLGYYANGEISSVVILEGGSGYNNNTATTLSVTGNFNSGNGNVLANITPVINQSGEIIDTVITNPGYNYQYATISINDTQGTGTSLYKGLGNVKILSVGSGYITNAIINTTATIATTGAVQPTSNAKANLIFSQNSLVDVVIVNPGSGYSSNVISNTSITILTTGSYQPTSNATANLFFNSKAILKPILYEGRIESIVIEDPGTGYSTNLTTSVSVIGDGVGAVLTPYINSVGQVEDIIIESRGYGYTSAELFISGPGSGANAITNLSQYTDLETIQSIVEVTAIDGSVNAIRINDGGDSFSHANISLLGDGVGFAGNVVVFNNSISKITIDSPGSGYTFGNVIITGDGANSNLTAIISPPGGHGKDAVTELFCDAIMMTSTINNDLNHGYYIGNDYRQFGIIKDLKKYNSGLLFDNVIGSACFLVSSSSGFTNLERDDVLYSNVNGVLRYFEVVEVPALTKALLLNKNNYTITTGDILTGVNSGQSYTISYVDKTPDINKSSGRLLYIDNRTAVSHTEQQLVTLRTVIRL